jgi:hypothetical protein
MAPALRAAVVYIPARREATKIAQKAAPAVIIWFRMGGNNRRGGPICSSNRFPDLAFHDQA